MKPLVAKVKTEMFLLITSLKKGRWERHNEQDIWGFGGYNSTPKIQSQAVLHAGCEEFEWR